MQFLAQAASAPTVIPATPPQVQTDFGNFNVSDPQTLGLFVTQFYGVGLGIIGGLALLFIMWGGYTIMMSQGNPSKVEKGKQYIFYSLAGLLLAVFGFVVMGFVTGALGVPTS
jgi:hypothetical protein